MPEMDGQSLASRIKSRADIPILVLSADATAESKADLIAHFAEDYVTKPYDYAELVARIRRVLRRVRDQIPVQELDLGDLVLVPRHGRPWCGASTVALSPTESRFLATLAAAHARAPSRPTGCSARSGPTRTPPIQRTFGSPSGGSARS